MGTSLFYCQYAQKQSTMFVYYVDYQYGVVVVIYSYKINHREVNDMRHVYNVTKWCKAITDSGKDEYTDKDRETLTRFFKRVNETDADPEVIHKYRLLDDDGVIYCYGWMTGDADGLGEEHFAPLDYYEPLYGCCSIEYYNKETREWEEL